MTNLTISEAMPCWWIFFHRWTSWTDSEDFYTRNLFQYRVCSKCGKRVRRYIG